MLFQSSRETRKARLGCSTPWSWSLFLHGHKLVKVLVHHETTTRGGSRPGPTGPIYEYFNCWKAAIWQVNELRQYIAFLHLFVK